MSDLVIVGGGLSGLVAAHELADSGLDVTLIEVKRRLGGSIRTRVIDGFVIDDGMAVFVRPTVETIPDWLETYGLSDEVFSLQADDTLLAFQHGSQVLVDRLRAGSTATRLMRTAVSSIGELEDGRHAVCLENGIMMHTRAILLATPARYTERMFYGYINEIAAHLRDYHYDQIVRVALGFSASALPGVIPNAPLMTHPFHHLLQHRDRTPDGMVLLQAGVRVPDGATVAPDVAVRVLRERYDLPEPVVQAVSHWPEADPLSCFDDEQRERVEAIRALLPERIRLVGSDYLQFPCVRGGVADLSERIAEARRAAQELRARLT